MKRIRLAPFYAAVLLLCLCAISGVKAQAQTETPQQPTLDSTFTTADGTFRLQYPGSWSIHERDNHWITMGGDNVSIAVVTPAALSTVSVVVPRTNVASSCLTQFIAHGAPTEFHYGKPETVTLPSGSEAERATFTTDDKTFAAVTAAMILSVAVGKSCALMQTFGIGIDFDALDSYAYAIADSFEVGTFSQPAMEALPTLEHFMGADIGGNPDQAISELERLNLIPKHSQQVYAEQMMLPEFTGYGFQAAEKTASSYTDFVMAGLISWQAVNPGDTGVCALVTRVTKASNGDASSYLAVGATSSNTVIVVEKGAASDDPFVYQTGEVAEFANPTHILYIARADQLTVFVNGVAVIENLKLDYPPDGKQKLLTGTNMDSGCVMTGVWAYGLPSDAAAT